MLAARRHRVIPALAIDPSIADIRLADVDSGNSDNIKYHLMCRYAGPVWTADSSRAWNGPHPLASGTIPPFQAVTVRR
jgi:hypothetical protein